ncbi:hypothetical protein V5O48_011925 [Marasmius crinis-equi]|uniref:Fungal-type protein kinase domain-containing protein n=1 Tax=Marasmius crinis-equi TaxID=585013 RepID=A0ABR3F489_9AGAR
MASNCNPVQSTSQDNPPSSTVSLGRRKAVGQTSQNPSSSSSPRKAGNTSAPSPSLHAARHELIKKYTSIPEKSVDAFLHDLVPRVAQDVVDEVTRKLKEGVDMPKAKDTRKSNNFKYIALEEDGTVRGYGDTPAKSNLLEASVFDGLCMLINATIELAARLNGCSWVAHSSKQDGISGEKRNGSFLYLGWEQVLCSGEFEKRGYYDTQLDNPEPFVKFILGLALIKPEHFQQAPAPTPTAPVNFGAYDPPPRKAQGIDVTLYANHGEYLERIGIDSTMKRVLVGERIQYEIAVAGKVFVTERDLCDFKADHATGCTTRVWVVYVRGSDRSTKYVLKEGTKVEGDKLNELEKKIKADEDAGTIGNHGAADMKQWYQDHFLHKHTHEKLDQNAPGAQGEYSSICVVRDPTVGKDVSSVHSGSQRVATQGGSLQRRQGVFDDPARFHYRVAYEGRMTPLDSVSCRKTSSQVVIGVVRACWVLWAYGMVHRDVSSWNVFWDSNTSTGRLGDFDYLAEYGKSGTGTTKTGTPHFWSVEVEANRYLYRTRQTPDNAGSLVARLQASLQQPEPALDPPLFQHNLLHDLESVYWLDLWTFLYLIGEKDRNTDGHVDSSRKKLYEKVFLEDTAVQVQINRYSFLAHIDGPGSAESLWPTIPESIHDKEIQPLVRMLFRRIRTSVVSYFVDAERDLGPGSTIPYGDPPFAKALTELYKALLLMDSLLGGYRTFPVTPLVQHKYVLADEPGPYGPVRWPGAEDDDEEEHNAVLGSSCTSKNKNKRQRTERA